MQISPNIKAILRMFIFIYIVLFYFYDEFVERSIVMMSKVVEAHKSCKVLRSEETRMKSHRREANQLSLWQNLLQCLSIN